MSRDKGAKARDERKKEIEEAKKDAKPEPQRFGNAKDIPVKEPL